MSASSPSSMYKVGVVKQVLSGDTVIIRRQPKGGPPPEKVIALSGITAPKLARQRTANNDSETKDEPFAWEAREFLRKKLVGKEVIFTAEKPPNSATREYGSVWAGKDPTKDENITEALLAEGLVKVRDGGRNIPQLKRLVEIEDSAKSQGKGIWGNDTQEHVRNIKWSVENPKQLVSKLNGQPVKAIIEYVRDGSTVRLCLLPEYTTITLMLSGIRCPTMMRQDSGDAEPYAEEARFFLESKLLHKDVEVILEAVNNNNNNNFVGTILHPQGNIAEALVRQGFARCVDWSLAVMKTGASTLRAAERAAKDAKLRIWTNYTSNAPVIAAKDKEFTATVMEIVNGDALFVKMPNSTLKKIFIASIRPPREKNNGDEENKQSPRAKGFKPLYDIPWMFEAREYLRKLVGKKVNVIVDYIQPAKDSFPEKTCCTVLASGINIAEALVSKGYATVVRYRNDNDQRSSQYHLLLEAENKAQKSNIGVFAKKDIPAHRIQDTSGDSAKAKKFFPFLKRAQKTEAVVEFVASGSRMRLYIPKESVLVTFLLAGINCPRGARPAVGGGPGMQDAEPFGDEALHFTKEKCLQHDVVVTIEEMDKAGNFIGWLWVDNENLSVSLVEHGLATTHHTAETSEFARVIKTAEENAVKRRIGLWKNYVEVEKEAEVERNAVKQDRTVKYDKVIITEITSEGHFYAQNVDLGSNLENLMEKIHLEFKNNTPLPGAYVPRKGQICAARFALDNQWYRAKVEKIAEDKKVHIFYIDYGNREVVDMTRLAVLPAGTEIDPPYVTEYVLCCVKFPTDPDDRSEAVAAFSTDTLNKKLLLNVETRGSPAAVTLVDPNTNVDLAKNLIKEGLVLMESIREHRLGGLMGEYRAAQEHAKSARLNLWRHGDITEDDALEFGARR